jgi:hypothetical protein
VKRGVPSNHHLSDKNSRKKKSKTNLHMKQQATCNSFAHTHTHTQRFASHYRETKSATSNKQTDNASKRRSVLVASITINKEREKTARKLEGSERERGLCVCACVWSLWVSLHPLAPKIRG